MAETRKHFKLLRLAEEDFDLARSLEATRPDRLVGFNLQQAVEKALKAIICQAGEMPERTHNLQELLRAVERLNPTLELDWDITLLNAYAVQFRYDDEIPAPPLRREEIVAKVSELLKVARAVIYPNGMEAADA